MQNLQIELEGLYRLREFLGKLHNMLGSTIHSYTQNVEACRESGLAKEIAQGFTKRLEQDVSVMKKLLHNIEECDIPYVLRQIRSVEEEIQAAY